MRNFLAEFHASPQPDSIVAGVVPHAGWVYSGAVAAQVFENIRKKTSPGTFIILGAVHRWAGINSVYARGAWETPFGNMLIDEELAENILQATASWTVEEPKAHSGEHSIEVQLPMLKLLFPNSKIIPIAINPDSRAVPIGRTIGQIVKTSKQHTVIIGSTDLTHYGDVYGFTPMGYGPRAHAWFRDNDNRILRLAEEMQAEEIVPESQEHDNACGAGALAATVAAARELGAIHGYVIEHTDSFSVVPEKEFRMGVGYAGILF